MRIPKREGSHVENDPKREDRRNMKITYFLDWSGNPKSGVPTKVNDQVREWRRQNYEVLLILCCPDKFKQDWKDIAGETITYSSQIGRIWKRFFECPIELLRKPSDVIYFRYGLYSPLELFVIAWKFSVLEINAENRAYYKLRSRLTYFLFSIQSSVLNKIVNLFIHVTEESRHKSRTPSKSKFVTNGIDLENHIHINQNPNTHKIPKAIFVGSDDFKWNGRARLEKIATEVKFIEVYSIGLRLSSKSQVKELTSSFGTDFTTLLKEMDIGISTLDLQVLGIKEAAPLKTRHYLAAGLPVIAACRDSAFPNSSPFYFELEFSSDNSEIINLEDLRKFVEFWSGKRVPLEQLSEIDIKTTERKRLSFIREFYENSRGTYL